MIYALAVLFVIEAVILVLEIKIYKILSRCTKKNSEGKLFVRIVADSIIYGWVRSADITAVQNNMRAYEDHIRVETLEDIGLVQVRTIKQLEIEKSIIRVLIENM